MDHSQSRHTGESRAHFAIPGAGIYAYVVAVFVALLLLSNIGATKFIAVGPLTFDGGAILFPLTYIIGDVLSEVYGLRAARRAIILGFAMSILAAFTFWLIQIAPGADFWENQAAYESILGFVPAIVLGSTTGFIVGQLLNAYVLVRVKEHTQERHLWLRLVSSTIVGEFADTLVFCTIYGIAFGLSLSDFLNYLVVGFTYKVAVEVILLPVTYRVIAWVKRREPTYASA
ncbi:MAG TPA: hypothetical protein DCQ36_08820 [Actinobacteria bacterium]|jgi:uncharacterized integral membrane protein (TIGR00697 family)|nr:hypothetical protein [Actinomycetota bacterium]